MGAQTLESCRVAAPDERSERNSKVEIWGPAAILAAGLAPLLLYAGKESMSVFAAAGLTAGAATISGALLGFLFGIPRTLAAEGTPEGGGYSPNTNLEQISDWLTKILVGVGLVQIGELRGNASDLVDYVSPSLAIEEGGFTLAVLVFFVTTGFLTGYIWTRLWLPGAFASADRKARISEIATEVVAEREERGVEAIARVREQLDPEEQAVEQKDLDELIAGAPRGTRVEAFYLARDQRIATTKALLASQDGDPSSAEALAAARAGLARAIPVFRALVTADKEGRYHRSRAELGLALKDQPMPDLAGAEAELTRAIELRKDDSNPIYELYRAVCRIRLDPEFGAGRPSTEESRARILDDIDRASGLSWVAQLARREATPGTDEMRDVRRWLDLNEIDPSRFAR